jgi:drug/metabolite transporter (DMT)-like permease
LIGLLVGFVGVAITIGIDIHGANALSIAEIMVTAIGYARGPVVLTRYLAEIPPVTMVTASFVIATLIYLPLGLTHLPSHISLEVVGAVVALALICSVAGFVLFFELILDVGPARATVVTYLNPIVAVVAGVIFLGEKLNRGLAIGLPLVIIGSIFATWGVAHEDAENDSHQSRVADTDSPLIL